MSFLRALDSSIERVRQVGNVVISRLRSRQFSLPVCVVFCAELFVFVGTAGAQWNVSPRPILQWFESTYGTIENRMPDFHAAGYGRVWVPPPGRADLSNFSAGYDAFDRFDLGHRDSGTLYGTQTGFRKMTEMFHRAGGFVDVDAILNHNGFSDNSTTLFREAGGYPGFLTEDPDADGGVFGVPGTDGDFHSKFSGGDLEIRLSGLIDIDQTKNFVYTRHPVPGNSQNLPNAGVTPDGAGRLSNVPTEWNRQFYPDRSLNPIMLYNPATGQSNIATYPFNLDDPTSQIATVSPGLDASTLSGDPTAENAVGLLMRYAQWMVQVNGVDGFRLDAAKHIDPFFFDFFDQAVYRANPRKLLDGSTNQVYSYAEVYDGSASTLQSHIKKTINPNDIGTIGGNRDVLDFQAFFALEHNLSANGFQNDWRAVKDNLIDLNDDGLHNGSQGVLFAGSHDDHAPYLGSVAHAYTLMHPGQAVVYFNAKEHGTHRDFPKDGRGDALGGVYGDTISKLVEIRNSHGRGNYVERWTEKEIHAYERSGSAVVLLSNRTDSGYDSRTLTVDFAPGTRLIELTGNADSSTVDPNDDLPAMVEVFSDNGVSKINVRFPRNGNHGKGYLIYGLPTPEAPRGLELVGVDSVIAGGNSNSDPTVNGVTRLEDLHVIKGDQFSVRLRTRPVSLLGDSALRDYDADGDNAMFRIDGGIDANGNGGVDVTDPSSVAYGFEQFVSKRSPLVGGGDGEYFQHVDTRLLSEGVHFIESIAFRKGAAGSPPVYSSFTQSIYVDRLDPEVAVFEFEPWDSDHTENRDLTIQSTDFTADEVRVFFNLPADVTDEQIRDYVANGTAVPGYDMVSYGGGIASQVDRDLFRYGIFGVPHGNNVFTVVTTEITGTSSVERFTGQFTETARGAGLGDLDHDGILAPSDMANTAGALESLLYSQNTRFNPAADVNGDGLVDTTDLFAMGSVLVAQNASVSTGNTYCQVVRRRGDLNQDGYSNAADIDFLLSRFGSSDWLTDLNADGVTDSADMDVMLATILSSLPGDANLDGVVNASDFSLWNDNRFQAGTGWATGDFNFDGITDVSDFNIWNAHRGQSALACGGLLIASPTVAVPEPRFGRLIPAILLLWAAVGRRRFCIG